MAVTTADRAARPHDAGVLERALSVPLAQLTALPLEPVTIATIDSGMDGCHPALAGRIDAAWSMVCVDERWQAVAADPAVNNDRFGHGTAVGGLIAEVAPNARLIDIRVLDDNNVGSGPALLEGVRLALNSGAKVINMSLACKAALAPALNALCEQAYRARIAVVAAKRNSTLFDYGFPAEFSSSISVDIADPAGFQGLRYLTEPPIEFAARGEAVMAPAPGGLYTPVTGTSFATPIVSGICALLLGRYPALTLFELKSALKHLSATPG